MIGVIFRLTMRQMLGQRRTLLLGLLALAPILLALVYLLTASPEYLNAGTRAAPEYVSQDREWVAKALLGEIVLGSLLPLAALIFATAVLGSEIDDGTAVYLLSKPVPRWQILFAKALAAWAVTVLFTLPAAVIAAAIALAVPDGQLRPALQPLVDNGSAVRLVGAFGVAIVAGALVYTAVFVLLSLWTSRAFIVGLIYVFLWEGVVTRLFEGTRILSVRQYSRGLAELLADVPAPVFDARLAGGASIALMLAVTAGASWLALRRLARFEIGETG